MELKVWVEGIQRIVCGVSVNTTCQDIVFALAHATGKIGRFTLIERWRNNERLLAPTENPMKILLKWGEYASDVQFILQRSDQVKKEDKSTDLNPKKANENNDGTDQVANVKKPDIQLSDQTKEIQKSFGSPDIKCVENIGIVKGVRVPQKLTTMHFPQNESSPILVNNHEKTPSIVSSQSTEDPMQSLYQSKTNEINLADVRSSLDRKINNNNNNILNNNNNNNIVNADMNISCENLLDALNSNNSSKLSSNSGTPDLYKNAPPISSNGALVPPPYRDPPPPRNSPLQMQQQPKMDLSSNKRMEYLDNINTNPFINENEIDSNDNFYQNVQYKDLIQLIKFQREKITFQQSELTKFDAEIIYLESKERDQAQELESISREITKVDQIFRQGSEQLQSLQYVEEENELVKQQEKTLKSEITLLRSKLANCETELLQCKNKIRLIMDDIQIEQRSLTVRQKDNRQTVERDFLNEMERIQTEIDQAIYNTDSTSKNTDNLKKEILLIENAIAEKKRQVEQLVNEMKEVNLQSLAVTPTASSDEIRNLLEGSNRPGSTRRIIGSPRQLENAVPTSKNPHGVWV